MEKKQVIKYKPISGRLHEHFVKKLLADDNIKNVDKVHCIHCDKLFTYHVTNMSHVIYTPTSKQTIATLSKIQLAKSASFCMPTAALSSTSTQTNLSLFYCWSDHPVSATVQRDIKMSPANWIGSSGRPISIVELDGLQQVLRTVFQ